MITDTVGSIQMPPQVFDPAFPLLIVAVPSRYERLTE